MNIKEIIIKNFRCFNDKTIELAQPDGSPGSGLTILIGENGNGKTTVLESINYITENKFTAENKLKINDFCNYEEPIDITATISDIKCMSGSDFYKDYYFEVNGIKFVAKSRDTKARNKILSSSFDIKNIFIPKGKYTKPGGSDGKDVDSRDLVFGNNQIIDEDINIFYFDKNRTRQMSVGNYKTTMEKIIDELNWRFIKNLNQADKDAMVKNISGDYFAQIEKVISGNPGSKLADELSKFFDNQEYKKLRIDLLNLLHPFESSFFVLRDSDKLDQKLVANLGSGVEMITTILLLRMISSGSKGSIVYLVDEPEMHLHPKAQEKLLELLIDESKDKQVIISTHSPYMFKGIFSTNAKLLVMKRNDNGEIEILDSKNSGWGLFGSNSPTWGEINYFAYDMSSIEFHNELYGFVQAKAIDEDGKYEKTEEFDNYLLAYNSSIDLDWIHEKSSGDFNYKVTLQTYIRNSIHHPENTKNLIYTTEQLKESIVKLIEILGS